MKRTAGKTRLKTNSRRKTGVAGKKTSQVCLCIPPGQ